MENLIVITKITVIIVSSVVLYRALFKLIGNLRKKDVIDSKSSVLLREIIKWVIILVSLLLIFHLFGIDAPRILTAISAVAVMFAVGFVAAWSILSNVLSALLLLLFPPFRFGDEIEFREPDKELGIRGTVIGLSLFFTTLESNPDNGDGKKLIKIPNTMFFQRVTICHEGAETEDLKLKKIERTENIERSDPV
jgi:small-conductance mechanosensitive channel